MGTGFLLVVTAFVADLVSVNRKLLENIDWRVRQMEEWFREKKEGAP
jgi:ABC-type molybdenum transport system ATPase subunit/photorepair protein PhrA